MWGEPLEHGRKREAPSQQPALPSDTQVRPLWTPKPTSQPNAASRETLHSIMWREQLSCEPWQCTESWKTRNRHFKPLSLGMFCCTVKDNWGMVLSSLKPNTQVFSAFMSQHQYRSCHATNAKSHLFGYPPASVICKEGKQKNGRNSGPYSKYCTLFLGNWRKKPTAS